MADINDLTQQFKTADFNGDASTRQNILDQVSKQSGLDANTANIMLQINAGMIREENLRGNNIGGFDFNQYGGWQDIGKNFGGYGGLAKHLLGGGKTQSGQGGFDITNGQSRYLGNSQVQVPTSQIAPIPTGFNDQGKSVYEQGFNQAMRGINADIIGSGTGGQNTGNNASGGNVGANAGAGGALSGGTLSQIAKDRGVPLTQLQQLNPNADLKTTYALSDLNFSGRDIVNKNVLSDNNQNNQQADLVMTANQAHQQYLNDFAQLQNSTNQTQTLTQQYQQLSQQLGIPALNTQLLNMKNVMNGSEQDIRDEITKAGGFATNSQVLALTTSRNKVMIQNYNNLLQTRDDMQKNLTTMMGLAEKDRAYASAQIDKQLNFDQQRMQYADKMLTNAQDSLNNTAKQVGWDAVLRSALATGDSQAVQRINSIMGNGFDLATMAKGNNIDQQIKEANLANVVAETRKINFDMRGGGINTTVPVSNNGGKTSYVPTNLAPYYNVSNNGVEYIDASALQGTAAQKTALVNEATQAGYKVITNKNTAADLVNIKDANGKLDSISTILAGISQPGWIYRTLYGLGLTKLATLTQSNPQQAAAGALQSIGLDILKAISGVQGFRGNQTAVQQVTDHLPKITDTVDTINKKIFFIRTLINDRENAAVGKSQTTKPTVVPADQVPAGYYQASDGLFYKK